MEKNEIRLMIAEEVDYLLTEALLGGVPQDTAGIELLGHLKTLSEARLEAARKAAQEDAQAAAN